MKIPVQYGHQVLMYRSGLMTDLRRQLKSLVYLIQRKTYLTELYPTMRLAWVDQSRQYTPARRLRTEFR